MTILVKKDNQWLSIKNIYTYQNKQWKTIKQGYVKHLGNWQSVWQNAIIFINDKPQTSINIFELMGSPNKVGNYIFINNAEIIANNGEIALTTGIFPKGSTLSVINNSYIIGYGGNGGTSEAAGQNGGDAICIEMSCFIDNISGYIFAGAGGGGGITVNTNTMNIYRNYYMGGAGGAPNGKTVENFNRTSTGFYDQYEYTDPANQNGGYAKVSLYAASTSIHWRTFEFTTGNGGVYGENGTASQLVSNNPPNIQHNTVSVTTYEGGTSGLAINKNSFEITLINSNPERIKGEIL